MSAELSARRERPRPGVPPLAPVPRKRIRTRLGRAPRRDVPGPQVAELVELAGEDLVHRDDLLARHVRGPAARLRPADLATGALAGAGYARELVRRRDPLELSLGGLDPDRLADPGELGHRVGPQLLVADQHPALGVGARVGLLDDLGAVQPDARLPADQGGPPGVVE